MQIVKSSNLFSAEKQIQDQESEEAKKATWEDSIKFRNKWSVMDRVDEVSVPFNLSCDLSKLSQFGPGIQLFFEYLKYAAIAFFLMTLVSIPAIYSNYTGNGLSDAQLQSNTLPKLSISNQPQVVLIVPAKGASNATVNLVREQNLLNIEQFVEDQQSRSKNVTVPDIVYSAIFLIFILWFTLHSQKLNKSNKLQNVVPSRYSIEVSGFPSTIVDSKELLNHFQKHFKADIFECILVRNYYNTLFLHKKEAEIIDQIKSEQQRGKALKIDCVKKVNMLTKKLIAIQKDIKSQIHDKLNGVILQHDKYPSLKAYIVFNNLEDKLKVEKQYLNIWSFLCFTNRPKAFKLYNKYDLEISFNPDEPSNILWENVEVSETNRYLRSLVVLLLVIVVMLISFAIIIAANIVKPSKQSSCPTNTITISEAYTSKEHLRCFCLGQTLQKMSSNKEIQNMCWDVWVQQATTYALTIGTGFVIIMVNFILRKTIEALGKYSRYNTITKFSSSLAVKLFFAFFVNTALITLFLQASIYGFIPAVIFTKPIPQLSSLQSDKQQEFSPDFDRDWYLSIGSKITITVFFFIAAHVFFEFVMIPFWRHKRESRVKKILGIDIQRIANKFILGPEFAITFYYASSMNIIFTTLFYSSGIPIMIPTGFVILTIQYWVYKYKLLRVCKRPPAYDTEINNRMLSILPWALVFHLAVGIYMYGQPLIFPTSSNQLVLEMKASTTSTSSDYDVLIQTNETSTVKNRAFHILYLLIFLLVIVGIFIMRSVLGFLFSCFDCCCGKSNVVHPSTENRAYFDEYEQIESRIIASYNMKMNDNYRLIVQAIDIGHKIELNSTQRGLKSVETK